VSVTLGAPHDLAPRPQISMLNPVSPRRQPATGWRAGRLDSLAGKHIGLLYNGKPGGEHILTGVEAAVASRYPDATFSRRGKPHASADATFLADMVGVWDAAVIAVGDCGSCSTYAIKDGTALEKLGIPTAVFITRPFTEMSLMWARRLEVPELGIVAVEHPVAHLSADVLARDWAAPQLDRIEAILTGKVSA
jgi:hypothetical protein